MATARAGFFAQHRLPYLSESFVHRFICLNLLTPAVQDVLHLFRPTMSLYRPVQLARSLRPTAAPTFFRQIHADAALDLSSAPPSASSRAVRESVSTSQKLPRSVRRNLAAANTQSIPRQEDGQLQWEGPQTHFLVTLRRSTIGLPKSKQWAIDSLGLKKKLHRSVLHPYCPNVAGNLLKVKELVSVKNVTLKQGQYYMARDKNAGEERGWSVVGMAEGAKNTMPNI